LRSAKCEMPLKAKQPWETDTPPVAKWKSDFQYRQQPQRSFAAGHLREPSPEATGGEKQQEEVISLRAALVAERRTCEAQSIQLQKMSEEKQNFNDELFRVRTELMSLLDAKERLFKEKEADYAALQGKLGRGNARSHFASRTDGACAMNYHDEPLQQIVKERDDLKAELRRHEDWHKEILQNADEVERVHKQKMREQEDMRRELESVQQELQRIRRERDEALSSRGREGNGNVRVKGWDGSVRDGQDSSGRETSWEARGCDNGRSVRVYGAGERDGSARDARDNSGRESSWDARGRDNSRSVRVCGAEDWCGQDSKERAGFNGREDMRDPGRDANSRVSRWDGSGRGDTERIGQDRWDGSGQDSGSSKFCNLRTTGCSPDSLRTTGCSPDSCGATEANMANMANIVEDPSTPAPLVRSRSSYIKINGKQQQPPW